MIETVVAAPLALSIHWDGDMIRELKLRWSDGRDGDPVAVPHMVTETGRAMQAAVSRYVAGKAPAWPELPLDFSRLSPFCRGALTALATVAAGTTTTYGELAAMAGNPGAARAAGRAMATNPFPLVLPCHRVVGKNGALTGFGPGLPMKRWLLGLEGALSA
ncbi:MAG: methylated-DNA--[protein]-cysteine S-methyltransferase [Thermodesulfobacteriota bacterium]